MLMERPTDSQMYDLKVNSGRLDRGWLTHNLATHEPAHIGCNFL